MRFAGILVGVVAIVGGCLHSNEVTCADGTVCPADSTCDATHHRCLSPAQLAACEGVAEGGACTLLGVAGVCRGAICDPLICGDGTRSGGEACDGSDLGGADCTTAGFYAPGGLACSAFCTFDVSGCVGRCGDHVVNGPEICDGEPPAGACIDVGFDAGALACSSACGFGLAGCARFGWTAEVLDPTRTIAALAASGTAPDDQWVVGAAGAITHFDGARWTPVASGTTHDLLDVSARATDDAWAVGADVVLHWDGQAWQALAAPTATYTSVSAVRADAVFVATQDAGVLAYDGHAWSTLGALATVPLHAIRGTAANDLWAIAIAGPLYHWDGASWTDTHVPGYAAGVAPIAPGDAWVSSNEQAVGVIALVLHWDGTGWTQRLRDPGGGAGPIAASGPDDVWLAASGQLTHYDGTGWVETISAQTTGLYQRVAGEALAVTYDGQAYRQRGQVLRDINLGITTSTTPFVWADRADDIFVGTTLGKLAHFDGRDWRVIGSLPSGVQVHDVAASGSADLWVAGSDTHLYHWDGPGTTTFTAVATVGLSATLYVAAPDDVWAVGSSVQHLHGGTWDALGSVGGLAVAGSGPSDVFVKLTDGSFLHWDGTSTVAIPAPSVQIGTIAAVAPHQLYAIADQHVLHWDGATWTSTFVAGVAPDAAIAATAIDDLVVASDHDVLHFDGAAWSPVRLPVRQTTIPALAAVSRALVFAYPENFSLHAVEILRTRPWTCKATETACANGLDDDCDGAIDAQDGDCP